MRTLIAIASIVALAACDSGPAEVAPTPDAHPASPATFRLSYHPSEPDAPPVIHLVRACTTEWIRVLGDDLLRPTMEPSCARCPCASCATSCSICDCGRVVWPVETGASRDYAWDGTLYIQSAAPGCNGCETGVTLEPGRYIARFCYSADLYDFRSICVDQPFDYPTTDVVEHVVTALP